MFDRPRKSIVSSQSDILGNMTFWNVLVYHIIKGSQEIGLFQCRMPFHILNKDTQIQLNICIGKVSSQDSPSPTPHQFPTFPNAYNVPQGSLACSKVLIAHEP